MRRPAPRGPRAALFAMLLLAAGWGAAGWGAGGCGGGGSGGDGGGGGGGGGIPVGTVVPDFSLPDANASSPTFAQEVSPRDHLGSATAWYFAHAT